MNGPPIDPPRPRKWGILLGVPLLLSGCGTSTQQVSPHDRENKSATTHIAYTDFDPEPYCPPPQLEETVGRIRALSISGAREQAQRLAIRFFRALLDRDRETLEAIFAPTVLRIQNRSQIHRKRIVQECIEQVEALKWRRDKALHDVIDIAGIDVQAIQREYEQAGIPKGVRATDLIVAIPLRDVIQTPLNDLFQHKEGLAEIYVRPGSPPRIIGVYR